jgi:hypothetical protein
MAGIRAASRRQTLSASEIEGLQRLKLQLNRVTGEDIESASELIDKMLEIQIRIEQERY